MIIAMYNILTFVLIIYLSLRLAGHECRKTPIEIQHEYKEKMEEINNAEDPNTIDSLLRELYGFSSKG